MRVTSKVCRDVFHEWDVAVNKEGIMVAAEKAEYRLTRYRLYELGCIGYENLLARQGHYVLAASGIEAAEQLRKSYPGEKFDVQRWDGEQKGTYIGRF